MAEEPHQDKENKEHWLSAKVKRILKQIMGDKT